MVSRNMAKPQRSFSSWSCKVRYEYIIRLDALSIALLDGCVFLQVNTEKNFVWCGEFSSTHTYYHCYRTSPKLAPSGGLTACADCTIFSRLESHPSSVQASFSSSSSPFNRVQIPSHNPFLWTMANTITTGKCHTLAQNKPLALPFCPSLRQNRHASLTIHALTTLLVTKNP